MPFDLTAHMKAMSRTVRNLERDGKPAKAVVASYTYATDPADLWDAVDQPQAPAPLVLRRCTGDLKVKAENTRSRATPAARITRCEPREADRGDAGNSWAG